MNILVNIHVFNGGNLKYLTNFLVDIQPFFVAISVIFHMTIPSEIHVLWTLQCGLSTLYVKLELASAYLVSLLVFTTEIYE